MSKLLIKVSSAGNKSSWTWKHPRFHVAVLECEDWVDEPSMISLRAKGVIAIKAYWPYRYRGTSQWCQFARALRRAEEYINNHQ